MSQPVNTTSFKIRQRNKILDQRRLVVRALAQPDRSHLRQRADRLRQSRRTASTPAIIVVATAPSPTTITPSLPFAGATLPEVFEPDVFVPDAFVKAAFALNTFALPALFFFVAMDSLLSFPRLDG
jgi:hypothetical protein